MSKLLEALATELERPRTLSTQVADYISSNYGMDYDAVGSFLVDGLPKVEDYELDLILSPLFTPKLHDQALFAELLGSESVPREQWPALVQQLAARPTRAPLITSDSRSHSVALREVTIERYVHRLRLDGSIPESLFKVLDQASSADRPMIKAIARRAIWGSDARRNILVHYVTRATDLSDAVDMLNLVENSKPSDLADLLARIPRRQEVLRELINVGSGSKPFFSERVQQMHGGDRDQRQEDPGMSAKQNELAFLERMQEVLA